MSDALEKLKSIGTQKIYEDTHIPVRYVQAILEENYEGFSRMQFLGFISILERDYDIDLQEVKSHAIEYYDTETEKQPLANEGVFVTPLKQKNFTVFYIVVAFFIFVGALYYTFNITDKVNNNVITPLVQTKKNITTSVVKEANNTNTTSGIKQMVENNIVSSQTNEIPAVPEMKSSLKEQNLTKQVEPLEILPRSRVWLGYINVATNKKYQKTFSGELDLNASKEWLLISGHGYIDVMVNGKKIHFSDRHTLRLHYKDGNLTKISIDEFKKLNRGRKW